MKYPLGENEKNTIASKTGKKLDDYKPYKSSDGVVEPNRSVAVFQNNKKFQEDNAKLIEEIKAKKEVEDYEQLAIDVD